MFDNDHAGYCDGEDAGGGDGVFVGKEHVAIVV